MPRFIGGGQHPGSDPIAILKLSQLPAPAQARGSLAVIDNGSATVENGDEAVADNSTGVTQLLFSNGTDWLVVAGGAIPAGSGD
jgi:hypothetical protein